MPSASANGITIEFDTFGEQAAPALLLVMGLGAQMIAWPEDFCKALADEGFFVIRYDNRDVGLSTKIEGGPPPDVVAAMTGDASSAVYRLDDMAADGMGLLDALGIDEAHIVGASMGGMIVQTMAINHPDRVRSLCSIMSTTGNPSVGQASPAAMTMLLRPRPANREEAIEAAVEANKVIGSPGFPFEEDEARERAAEAFDRCFYPEGFARQLVAIIASGDRTEALGSVTVPTLVIHGTKDPLVTPSGGEATARAIPGATLLEIDGMGHDLPVGAWPQIIPAIAANAAKAGSASKGAQS